MNQSINTFLFGLDLSGMWIPTLSIIEKIIRPLIVYFFLIFILRITGKRELSQINTFDFIVLLMLSNVVQNSIIGNDNSVTGGIIGAISLLGTNYLVEKILYKSRKLDDMVEGESEYLIRNGKLNKKNLDKELISRKDLLMAAHKQGISSFDEVEKAEIDPNGGIIFIKKILKQENTDYTEIIRRLDKLTYEIESLKSTIETQRSESKK